jgi:hypothetical protein
MKTQSSLANGDDRVLFLTSPLVIRRVGAMKDRILTDNLRPPWFPKPQVTGVPIVRPELPLHPSQKLLQDARIQRLFRRVQGLRTKKRLGLWVVNSSQARMKAQGAKLVHSKAEVTWAPLQVRLILPQTLIGGVDHGWVFHHAAVHLVSLIFTVWTNYYLLEGVATSSTPPTPQLTRRKLELLPRSGNTSATPSPLASPKMAQSTPASRPSPFGAARFVSPARTRFSCPDRSIGI